jgi:predicted GH43/DUF377 family glycosyl hydrolase
MERLSENPLLCPEDLPPTREDLEVLCTLNPAAVRFGEEVLLLVRVGERPIPEEGYVSYVWYDAESSEVRVDRIARDDPDLDTSDPRLYIYKGRTLLTSMSHLRIARSDDGRNFRFEDAPAIFPATAYEAYGCEDARITFIDGRYWVSYTAVSRHGVTEALASTTDFATWTRHGLVFPPYQKDVAIFPERVRDLYVCRHRPFKSAFNLAAIWTAYSPDLFSWGRHEVTLEPTLGTWESDRVGGGAPPIKTDEGWLEIYHAADANGRYALGAMLSDLQHPHILLSRSREPVFVPEAAYELSGVYGNCVFSNGLLTEDDGTLTVHYGAGDSVCAAAVTSIEEMVDAAANR